MNLAIALNLIGRPAPALPAIRKAVEIRRVLARDNPDGDLVFLARALTELSSCLVFNARPQDGAAAGQQSVDIRRQLAETNPDRHTAGLALSLRQTATALRFAGSHAEAALYYREAITIERGLLATHPGHGMATALAESITGYAAMLTSLQHLSAALPLAHEGERLIAWRKNETSPEALLPAARSLSNVLTNIADVLDANERTSEAQAHRREAAALLRGTIFGPQAAEPDATSEYEV